MGETGKGQATKLAMNLQIALIYEGFAEALTLATKLGVSTEALLPLVQASMVRSGVVDYKAPFILKRDFSPNFPLRLMLKDIRLALAAAKEAAERARYDRSFLHDGFRRLITQRVRDGELTEADGAELAEFYESRYGAYTYLDVNGVRSRSRRRGD